MLYLKRLYAARRIEIGVGDSEYVFEAYKSLSWRIRRQSIIAHDLATL